MPRGSEGRLNRSRAGNKFGPSSDQLFILVSELGGEKGVGWRGGRTGRDSRG